MDRNKIEEAARLDAELKNLEWLIGRCPQRGLDVDYENLMCVLSPVGKATIRSAILCEARTDRIELERKIAEL